MDNKPNLTKKKSKNPWNKTQIMYLKKRKTLL